MKKRKLKKIRKEYKYLFKMLLVVVLVFSIFLIRKWDVFAASNDSTLEKNRVDNIYAISTINGEKRIFYLNMYTMNGRYSYCIDLGVDITTNIYHSTHNFFNIGLSQEQVQYIRLVSYFGYLYEGHTDYKYYMAAQELIWEYLSSGTEIEWTSELDVNGKRINVDSYKKEILELSNWFVKTPCFDVNDSYVVGDEIVLTDKCNVLSGYRVSVSKDSKVSIEGNNLKIKVANKIMDDRIILTRKFYYTYVSTLYYYDDSQRLLSNGNMSNINKYIEFKINGLTLTGQVVGKDEAEDSSSLEGAIYEVYDEERNLVGTYESDINGKFVIDNLLYGTYYIKQIKASSGYKVNEEEVEFYLDKDNTVVNLEQDVEVIEKYDIIIHNKSNEGNNIAGNTFEVLDKDGVVIYTGVSDEEGTLKVEELLGGNYCIRQKEVLENIDGKIDDICFLLDKDKEVEVINNLMVNKDVMVPNTFSEDFKIYKIVIFLVMIGIGIFVYKKSFMDKLYN